MVKSDRLQLPPSEPPVFAEPREFEVHGVRLRDDFAWLKAANWMDVLKDPAVLPPRIRAHLEAENAFSQAVLAGAAPLCEQIVAEMRGRIKEDDWTVPEVDGAFAYSTRYREGGQHPLVCREPRDGGQSEILLDGDAEAKGAAFFDLHDADHSSDHRLLAWSADTKGSELFTIRVRDLATGKDLADEVLATAGEVVWCSDSETFYYVEVDEKHRPVRVKRHRVGTPATEDALVYEETESGWFIDLDVTTSALFIVLTVSNHETSEVWLLDRKDPSASPRLVAARDVGVLYSVDHHGSDLVILTNADAAEDFKIVTAPLAASERRSWRELIPHRPGIMILFHMALARHLVRLERQDANPRIVVRDIWTGAEHAVDFDEEAYSLTVNPGYEFDTETIRFSYSSMATPSEVYDYDVRTRARALRKRQEVPSGHEPSAYVTRRIFATAPDGEQIPISLLHRRGLVLDGMAPCLLYGYGSYGSSMPANFRTNPLSLVDRGFVYAIAHVPGGMLMGAVANMAPDLFAGIVADVPFVDVLNTMLDADLPLTPPEWPEWGNPGASEADFRTILSYSPYDNVKPQRYPPILALGGLTDPRVTYWEPAKWVARLRATMSGGGPVLLKINMEAGHAGAAGRFDRLEEVGLIYAFAIRAIEGFEDMEARSAA